MGEKVVNPCWLVINMSVLTPVLSPRGAKGVLLQVRRGEGVYGDARSSYQALEVRDLWAWVLYRSWKFIWPMLFLAAHNVSLHANISFSVINTFSSVCAEGLDSSPLLIRLAWIKFWPKPGTSWTPKQWVLCIYFPPPANPIAQCLISGFYNNPLERCNIATFYYVYWGSTMLILSS